MLTLEIELLTGVYRAASPNGSRAEWPPHPERIFSALVQAWADGGCDPLERKALEWLEDQGVPWIQAGGPGTWSERSAPVVFVPPNDVRGTEISVLPDRRRRQARSFRAAVPSDSTMKLSWPDAVPTQQDGAILKSLAHRVASLGHSSSLTRFAFTDGKADRELSWRPTENRGAAIRVPHKGRLAQLENWHREDGRPRPGMSARYQAPVGAEEPEVVASLFGGPHEWFVFEDRGTDKRRPDVLGFAHIAKRVRDSLMRLGPQPVPELLSGHTSDGAVTTMPHAAIVPLANVGWERATGDMLGFAVVLPRGVSGEARRDVLKALAAFARVEHEQACAELRLGEAGIWQLQYAPIPARRSLQPARWCSAATAWASVTPVLLDRFPDQGNPLEEARLVAAACRNIGLPEPVRIQIHKHSAIQGAPSSYPSRGDRRRPDWSFPRGAKFANRPRRHVVLQFDERVEGPVILGAARFYGLGLCLPLDQERRG
jgi:CRISPR-associated protein Csb2